MRYRIFDDRRHAGRELVPELRRLKLGNPLILGLARGGVPVAYEVAFALKAPLDTIIVRKLGAPFQPELAIGAIASGDVRVLNSDVIHALQIDQSTIDKIVARESAELKRREKLYRGERPYPDIACHDVVLVDDGIATGATIRAAAEGIGLMKPSTLSIAVPTAARAAVREISTLVDHMICLETPVNFRAVGHYYRDFGQTSDDEVRELLELAAARFEN